MPRVNTPLIHDHFARAILHSVHWTPVFTVDDFIFITVGDARYYISGPITRRVHGP